MHRPVAGGLTNREACAPAVAVVATKRPDADRG